MATAPLYRRTFCYGFCHGQFYTAAPSDGNITVSTAHHRGSGYACRVNAQAGVLSSVALPASTLTGQSTRFLRGYFWFASLPGATRVFWSTTTASPVGSTAVNLRITPAGKIEVRLGTTTLATSLSALTTGRWYRIEVGHDTGLDIVQLRVDGNVEIDWTATGGSGVLFAGAGIGALDTVAAAFEFFVTDVAGDHYDYPGYGKTALLRATALASDNANWVNTGGAADKVAALDPGTSYDDTTYLLCTTSGAEIGFVITALPAAATVIHGLCVFYRAVRNGATSSGFRPTWGRVDQSAYQSLSGGSQEQFSAAATTTVFATGEGTRLSVFGHQWPLSESGKYTLGIASADANGCRLTTLWAEVDYTDIAGERAQDLPFQICDFETAFADAEYADTNSTLSANMTTSTDQARFGNRSWKCVHPAGGKSSSRMTLGHYFDEAPSTGWTPRWLTFAFWVYVATRQTSGDMQLWWIQDNVTFRMALVMDATGALKITIEGSTSSATAVAIPTGQWHHVGIVVKLGPTSTTNATVEAYLDDVLVKTHQGTCGLTGFGATAFIQYGSNINVAGGATLYYDGIVHDANTLHTRHLKVATLPANAAGSATAAGFVATGAAATWDCVDDLPDDGDTTYVLLAIGLGTTTHESYALADLTPNALHVLDYVAQIAIIKRDAATNGTIDNRLLLRRSGFDKYTGATGNAATSVYGAVRNHRRTIGPWGKFSTQHVNDLEADIVQRSNTVATRLTAECLVVAYTAHNDYAPNPRHQVVAIG